MLRAVVSFLVAVPLLMPPGVCACRLGMSGPAPIARESAGVCPSPQRACCAHRKIAARHNVDVRAHSRDSLWVRESQSPPRPGNAHEPGCPALLTTDHSKVAERTNTPSPVLTTHVDGLVTVDLEPTRPIMLVGEHTYVRTSSRLYLSFRSLLI